MYQSAARAKRQTGEKGTTPCNKLSQTCSRSTRWRTSWESPIIRPGGGVPEENYRRQSRYTDPPASGGAEQKLSASGPQKQKGMTMTNETRKQIMYADHDREWAPQKRHVGPWQIYQPNPNAPRLVWAEVTRGNDTRTYCDCDWADK